MDFHQAAPYSWRLHSVLHAGCLIGCGSYRASTGNPDRCVHTAGVGGAAGSIAIATLVLPVRAHAAGYRSGWSGPTNGCAQHVLPHCRGDLRLEWIGKTESELHWRHFSFSIKA